MFPQNTRNKRLTIPNIRFSGLYRKEKIMNMKKTTAIILSAILALSLTGCSNNGGGNNGGNYGNYGGTENTNKAGNTNNTDKVTDKAISVTLGGDSLSGTYSGEWSSGKANGEGEFKYDDDYKLAITGTFKDGEPVEVAFLEEDSDGAYTLYQGKFVAGNMSDSNAYFESTVNGMNIRYTGAISNNYPNGQGDAVVVYEDEGYYLRYMGDFINGHPVNGDYQLYNTDGSLEETGKLINGERRTDDELAAENIIDNIGRAVSKHFGYDGAYDSLKKIIMG